MLRPEISRLERRVLERHGDVDVQTEGKTGGLSQIPRSAEAQTLHNNSEKVEKGPQT